MSNMKENTARARHPELTVSASGGEASPDLQAMAGALDAAIAAETPESIKAFVAQAYAKYDTQRFYFTCDGWQPDSTNTICKLPSPSPIKH